MIHVTALVLLGQLSSCPESSRPAFTSAAAHAAEFDLPGAIADLSSIAPACRDAEVARLYLQGLTFARDAYRYGGSQESLVPVRNLVSSLERYAQEDIAAEIARLVLVAAAAAAQSEREEMGVFLEQARRLEVQQRGSGAAGAPLVSAHEIAGDLWLQVHRFEDARAAYVQAGEQIGPTRRVTLGLARTASRLNDLATACNRYRDISNGWPPSPRTPSELSEARAFLRRPECQAAAPLRVR